VDPTEIEQLRERIAELCAERDALPPEKERDWPNAVELAELEHQLAQLEGD